MPVDPRDDFTRLASSEHMFFGLADPYGMIREEVEVGLRQQVPDTVVEAIRVVEDPKFLTLGRKTDDPGKVIVAHFGVCLRASIDVRFDGGRRQARLDATLTFLFGNVDRPGQEMARSSFDLNADAAAAFTAEAFERRFMAFRAALG